MKYVTTPSAGYHVAGIKIPPEIGPDGKERPQVGFVIELTEAEARYELLSGSIVEAPAEVTRRARREAEAG